MDRIVLGFDDFLNEEINFTRDNGVTKLEDRWFYYNSEDDIIYGSDEKPVWDDSLFAFNPVSCAIILGGEEKNYDINNPYCLFTYDYNNKVEVFTDDVLDFLKSKGYPGERIDPISQPSRASIGDFFETIEDDLKCILIYGTTLVASTFDIIEEN